MFVQRTIRLPITTAFREKTFAPIPIYPPGKEPPGYWEELKKKKPEPLVDVSKIATTADWIAAGASDIGQAHCIRRKDTRMAGLLAIVLIAPAGAHGLQTQPPPAFQVAMGGPTEMATSYRCAQ